MKDNKIRTTIWMKPDMVQKIDSLLHTNNCKSKSEFVCKAVDFYSGYLQTGESAGYVSQTLMSEMKGSLELIESRICRIIFKLAVETSIMMNVVAAGADLDDVNLSRLRGKCLEDVKKSLGSVRFDRVYGYQHYLDGEDDV